MAIGLAVVLGSCRQVKCDELCQRVRRCKPQVFQALVERLPSQSRFMKRVRKQLPKRIGERVLKSCEERCEALTRSKKWRLRLRGCLTYERCTNFARCIAPALEP